MLMHFCKDCWLVIDVNHECNRKRPSFDAIFEPDFFAEVESIGVEEEQAEVKGMFVSISEWEVDEEE